MKQNQYNQRKYVYLFELDSVRKTDKEIIVGQKALYTEIVENGNIVVLTFNQLIDSRAFFSLFSIPEYRESIMTLFEKGAIRITQFNKTKTVAQYWLNAMEEGKQFIYSAIPLKYTQYELVDILRRSLMYSDLSELYSYTKEGWSKTTDELKKLFPKENLSVTEMQTVMKNLYFMVSVALKLSTMNEIYISPKKLEDKQKFYAVLNKVLMFENSDNPLWERAVAEIKFLKAFKKKKLDRSAYLRELSRKFEKSKWKRYSDIQYAMDIINNCYNYVCEISIQNISKHYNIEELEYPEDGMPTFKQDFFARLNQQKKNCEYKQYEVIDTNTFYPFKRLGMLPNFAYAARVSNYLEYENKNAIDFVYRYEYGMEKMRRKQSWEIIKAIFVELISAIFCITFFTVLNILIAYMEEKIGTGDWKKINLFFQNCIALYIVELFTDKISRICPFIHPLSDSLRNGIRLVLDFFRSFFHHKKFYYNKCNQDVELEERQ